MCLNSARFLELVARVLAAATTMENTPLAARERSLHGFAMLMELALGLAGGLLL